MLQTKELRFMVNRKVCVNKKDRIQTKKPCHDANKKPCHDANQKDRMQTKNQKLSRCKQKRSDGNKKNKNCHDANKKDRMQTKNQKLSRCKQKDRMQTKQLLRYEADLVRKRDYSFWRVL